ncbi:MAG: DegT/DnrJ/EryC1/StrS family aminotransferase [Candidatus Paceibacterota bacterium]|jgi:perosamine synthetase
MAHPIIGDEETEAALNVLKSGNLAQGKKVKEFEEKYSDYCGVKYSVAVNSGTAALHAALSSIGIGKGDEVIVPAFSFIATASAVSMCGATPVFADIESDYFTIDLANVENLISDSTKAIIGVHLFGQPFDIKRILNFGISLIEDAAQAHGSTYHGKPVGGFGQAGCFSFYATKNMTTGEGGMVTTNLIEINNNVRRFINHGQSEKYLHTSLGYNYRMTDIAASIGIAQLEKLNLFNARRICNANYYDEHLKAHGVILPKRRDYCKHVFHQYVIRITDDCPITRSEIINILKQKGIDTAIHYPISINKQPMYKNMNVECPVAEKISGEILSIPVHPSLTTDDLKYVCDTINGVVENA